MGEVSGGLDTQRVTPLDPAGERERTAGLNLAQVAHELGETVDAHPDLTEVLQALGLLDPADASAPCGQLSRVRAHRAAGEHLDPECAVMWGRYTSRMSRAGRSVAQIDADDIPTVGRLPLRSHGTGSVS